MMTNLYPPLIGGIQRSVASFAAALRRRGHRVVIIAPECGAPEDGDVDTVRVPAIQNFGGDVYPLPLPAPGRVRETLDTVRPDLIHSHHPFLLGDAALSAARSRALPLVYTHHTMWEHYVGRTGESAILRRFVVELSTDYANLCDVVIAPSAGARAALLASGVTRPVHVVPTGIQLEQFTGLDRRAARRQSDIAQDAFVVGHVGRLRPQKNLDYLCAAIIPFLHRHPLARFLLVGDGPSLRGMEAAFEQAGVLDRVVRTGSLHGAALAGAYSAMDVFAFASHSESQGIVLAEALASGLPIVGLDAVGVRDVVTDGVTGLLLPADAHPRTFAAALGQVMAWDAAKRGEVSAAGIQRAADFSMDRCVDKLLDCYQQARAVHVAGSNGANAGSGLRAQWTLWSGRAASMLRALRHELGAGAGPV